MRNIGLFVGVSLVAMQPQISHAEDGADAAAAASDSSGNDGLEDIVVTARRSFETAQSVPMSITAFSQDMLRQQNIASPQDLGKAVPGLTVAAISGNPSIPAFAVRGRGLNFGAAAGAVETYFADVPLSMPFQAFALPPQFFDIGSFQVLKGPQGTLFGRSTTGGAVVIVPHPVEEDLGGYARLQGGTYNNVQAEGAINIPLAEGIAGLRLAGFYWKRDGYARIFPGNFDRLTGRSLDGERFNNKNLFELRGTLRLTPADGVENTTIVTYHSDANRGSAGAGLIKAGAGSTRARGFGTLWSNSDVSPLGQGRNKATLLVNTTTIEAGDELTLKNIFSYTSSTGYTSSPSNPDGISPGPVSLPFTPRLNKTKMYIEEFQLQGYHFDGRFKWVAGILFDWTRQPTALDKLNIQSISYGGTACGATPNCVSLRTTYGSNKVDSHGLFGSVTYEVVPNLTLSGGFRRSWDRVKFYTGIVVDPVLVTSAAASPLRPLPAASLTVFNRSFVGDTYNADISYKFGDAMAYAGYRRGYKRGGFQPAAGTPVGATFGPETVDNLYVGFKSQFRVAGRPVRANIELYHDTYHGQQVSYNTQSPLGIVSNELNIDRTTFKGFDVELSAEPADWWTLSANYGFIDAKVDKWIDRSVVGSTVDLTNNPVPYVSKHKLSATSRFHAETGIGEAVLQAAVSYEDKFYAGPTCRIFPLSVQQIFGPYDVIAAGGCLIPSHTTVDLRVELNNVANTGLDLAANATNIGNKIYRVGTSNTLLFGAEGFSYAPPRMFTVEASYKF